MNQIITRCCLFAHKTHAQLRLDKLHRAVGHEHAARAVLLGGHHHPFPFGNGRQRCCHSGLGGRLNSSSFGCLGGRRSSCGRFGSFHGSTNSAAAPTTCLASSKHCFLLSGIRFICRGILLGLGGPRRWQGLGFCCLGRWWRGQRRQALLQDFNLRNNRDIKLERDMTGDNDFLPRLSFRQYNES